MSVSPPQVPHPPLVPPLVCLLLPPLLLLSLLAHHPAAHRVRDRRLSACLSQPHAPSRSGSGQSPFQASRLRQSPPPSRCSQQQRSSPAQRRPPYPAASSRSIRLAQAGGKGGLSHPLRCHPPPQAPRSCRQAMGRASVEHLVMALRESQLHDHARTCTRHRCRLPSPGQTLTRTCRLVDRT